MPTLTADSPDAPLPGELWRNDRGRIVLINKVGHDAVAVTAVDTNRFGHPLVRRGSATSVIPLRRFGGHGEGDFRRMAAAGR